ncbi:uncharacterized protein [Aegilops tauschii subsp. strangulata]|nr:F-box protein At2g34280-like [Aegilops tauschii subsp. strangulata]
MEVFTIGTDRHWRETATQPPYPVLPRRSATFFKGSLIWTVDQDNLADPAPGFLRFSLENEVFGVMSPPPCPPRPEYTMSRLAELRGELCLVCVEQDNELVEMWMCDDVEKPRWDQRHTVIVSTFMSPDLYPIAAFDDEIVFKQWKYHTRRYDLKTEAFGDVFRLENLKYHNPSTGMLGYQRRFLSYFDVIPYVPSIIPLPKEGFSYFD